jgi:hypothetical protein
MSSSSCTLEDVLLDPMDRSISTPLLSGRLRIRSNKRQFPSRREREWAPAGGPGFSYPGGHIAVNLDFSNDHGDNFWNGITYFKVLEICGREFRLLIFPTDGPGVCDQHRRVDRFEVLPSDYTTALIHGPGLKGMEDIDWLRDVFKPSTTFSKVVVHT